MIEQLFGLITIDAYHLVVDRFIVNHQLLVAMFGHRLPGCVRLVGYER